MYKSWTHRTAAAAAALTTLAGLAVAVAAPATAAGVSASGTILYDEGGDVFATTPTRSATVQITHNGTVATADHTGDSGYLYASESDGGLVVAIRNQTMHQGQPDEYVQGFIWEMDRSGRVIRKFKPYQPDLVTSSCSPPVQILPQGIVNAAVSPDGQHIAYTTHTYYQSPCGNVFQGYASYVTDLYGTRSKTYILDDGTTGGTGDLEIGVWADSTHLLFDRPDFGSAATYIATAPQWNTTTWAAADWSDTDLPYGQPAARAGTLVTEGYVASQDHAAVRIWRTSGYNAAPWPSAI